MESAGSHGTDQRTYATEQHQQALENPTPEAPALVQEQTLRRSSSYVKPPEKVIKQIQVHLLG